MKVDFLKGNVEECLESYKRRVSMYLVLLTNSVSLLGAFQKYVTQGGVIVCRPISLCSVMKN